MFYRLPGIPSIPNNTRALLFANVLYTSGLSVIQRLQPHLGVFFKLYAQPGGNAAILYHLQHSVQLSTYPVNFSARRIA